MLNSATLDREWDEVRAAAEANADVWASVGIHPHDGDHHPDVETAKLVERAVHPRVIGIGETGLDYYYDKSDRVRQQDSFRRHIHASQRTGLPIIVHTRDADADTPALLGEEMDRESFPGVIHCFTPRHDSRRKAPHLGPSIPI